MLPPVGRPKHRLRDDIVGQQGAVWTRIAKEEKVWGLWRMAITVKYLESAPPPPPPPSPLKHKFLTKVGGGRLLGILPFVQSIIQPLKVQVSRKMLAFWAGRKSCIYAQR